MRAVTIRILIIDDEYELHSRLRTDLNTLFEPYQADLEISITASLTEAFRRFTKNITHLAVFDPIMADEPDYLISDFLQARSMPILVFSREYTAEQRVRYLKLGAEMVLPKPVEYEEYSLSAQTLLKRYYCSVNQQEEVSLNRRYMKFEIDPHYHIMRFGDEVYQVTKKEFEILQLLMDHPGKILSKDYIYRSVWKTDIGDGEKSVTDVIYRLRKKIGKEFDDEYLENVYSTGYRFGRAGVNK